MQLWRVCREAHQALDGEGARLYGGRWNPEGVAVVYASSTLALAALEYLIHVDVEDVPADLIAMQLDVPADAGTVRVAVADLPADWYRLPEHPACVALGDAWIAANEALLMRVPSAVVPEETNVLIAPSHARADDVTVAATRAFAYDPRLL